MLAGSGVEMIGGLLMLIGSSRENNVEAPLEEALRYESQGLYYARRAPNDVKESRDSFLEKRPGVYSGS